MVEKGTVCFVVCFGRAFRLLTRNRRLMYSQVLLLLERKPLVLVGPTVQNHDGDIEAIKREERERESGTVEIRVT